MKPVRACSVMSDSLQPLGLQPSRLLCAWNFPEKNDGVVAIFFSSDFPDTLMKINALWLQHQWLFTKQEFPLRKVTVIILKEMCYFSDN